MKRTGKCYLAGEVGLQFRNTAAPVGSRFLADKFYI